MTLRRASPSPFPTPSRLPICLLSSGTPIILRTRPELPCVSLTKSWIPLYDHFFVFWLLFRILANWRTQPTRMLWLMSLRMNNSLSFASWHCFVHQQHHYESFSLHFSNSSFLHPKAAKIFSIHTLHSFLPLHYSKTLRNHSFDHFLELFNFCIQFVFYFHLSSHTACMAYLTYRICMPPPSFFSLIATLMT